MFDAFWIIHFQEYRRYEIYLIYFLLDVCDNIKGMNFLEGLYVN